MNEAKLQANIDALRRFVESQGWIITNEKDIQSGYQLVVSNGLTRVPVAFFYSGKALIQGKPDESYLNTVLREKGREITIVQQTHAEEDISVAAASILARAEFVRRMEQLSKRVGKALPKGASDPSIVTVGRELVAEHGKDILAEIAKLHFKTTEVILQS